jgi:hypothetical protein
MSNVMNKKTLWRGIYHSRNVVNLLIDKFRNGFVDRGFFFLIYKIFRASFPILMPIGPRSKKETLYYILPLIF